MIGIETRPRVAAYAREALQGEAEIVTRDARSSDLPAADVVLLFDVLHLMQEDEQDALLASLVASLREDGVLIVREADASAGWRFGVVRAGNWVKALAVGQWRQAFHFRSIAEWTACFTRLGLEVEVRQMSHGTPFGNVLFRLAVAEHDMRTVSHGGSVRDSAPVV
jgi:hypothetical protein